MSRNVGQGRPRIGKGSRISLRRKCVGRSAALYRSPRRTERSRVPGLSGWVGLHGFGPAQGPLTAGLQHAPVFLTMGEHKAWLTSCRGLLSGNVTGTKKESDGMAFPVPVGELVL